MTPQYGYAVCRDVSNSTTVPVPMLSVLEVPQVYLYPSDTLRSQKLCELNEDTLSDANTTQLIQSL